MGALEEILDRIVAFEEQTIAGSAAYPGAWVQTLDSLYWTNKLDITSFTTLGVGYAQMIVTAQLRLHRCKFTQLQTDATLQRQCYADLGTIARAFSRSNGRDFISTAYPSAHPNLLPSSEVPINGVLAVIPAPDGTDHFGAVITITFAYIEAGAT